jgi:hypothetical protein
VPLAALLALPVIWDWHSLSMLLAVLWFARRSLGARLISMRARWTTSEAASAA